MANTLLDFVLFHALTGLFGISLGNVWAAKAISGTVAIANSFYLNRRWVFRADDAHGLLAGQAFRFVIATLIGVYVIQTSLTQFFATGFPAPGEGVYRLVRSVGADDIAGEDFVLRTVAFALATAFSLSWNFAAYKWWAFRRRG